MHKLLSHQARLVHLRAMEVLEENGIPALVGGAYAMFHYTGVHRHTKDLDLFLSRHDEARARRALLAAGYRTEVADPVWLSKALWGEVFVDLIFCSGNGVSEVDQQWFDHAISGQALGREVLLVPPEEMIWSKAFVQERERFDGADVAHLFLMCASQIDWQRLLERFGEHWQVLLAHLLLFSFSYPGERGLIPDWLWEQLLARAAKREPDLEASTQRLCRGTLLSRKQYDLDVGLWGFRDARSGFSKPLGLLDNFHVHETPQIHETRQSRQSPQPQIPPPQSQSSHSQSSRPWSRDPQDSDPTREQGPTSGTDMFD